MELWPLEQGTENEIEEGSLYQSNVLQTMSPAGVLWELSREATLEELCTH